MANSVKPKRHRRVESNPNDSITDPRFANIQTDPRFRLPSRKNTHVKIGKRFAHMLRDERFSSKAKVDRYGRRLPKDSGKKELERFYRVDDEEEAVGTELVDDDEVERELKRVEKKYDPARDGGFSESSSDETTSEEDEDSGVELEDGLVGDENQELEDGGNIPAGEVSSRIAIVNLDWDNIRAVDLMAVFRSFAPDTGRILKVSVYPSEFGKERMQREETEGPPKEIFAKKAPKEPGPIISESEDDEDEDDEDEDEKIKSSMLKEDLGEEFDSAQLRRYQLQRLRYYYAVLTCSSKSVAEAIYNAVDGTEYLTTANFFDLRFIPDDMDFSDEKPRDDCESIPDGYRPNDFVTDALQHSNVKLTWDAEDKTRKEVQRRAFSGSRADIDENDLKAYLGSDTSEDDEAPEAAVVAATNDSMVHADAKTKAGSAERTLSKKDAERQRMRALLGLGAEPTLHGKSKAPNAPVGDMQITFSSGLSSLPKKGSVFENEPVTEETTVEKYIRREKERKARRKEKVKAARDGIEVADAHGASEDQKDVEVEPMDMGFDDPFFTAPKDDKAATTALRKEQKRVKRAERAAAEVASSAQRAELELLMIDDDTHKGSYDPKRQSRVNHFDINEIAKAEKALKKKNRSKLSAREKDALEAKEKDAFKMDVRDPRFEAVFERPEFAVDPSHPRFKGTEGMKSLLEEGRRKRARERKDDVLDEDKDAIKKQKANGETNGKGEDLTKLVERIKGKTK